MFLGVLLWPLCQSATRGQSQPPAQEREKEIADLQKQIEALAKKLEAIKKSEPTKTEARTSTLALGPEWLKPLSWRSLGPANMGGRITALAVFEDDPCTYWVATAGGGLLKTVNNGVTFEHQFDHESTVAIGDVQVARSNRDVVWVGTGEANPRNSVSYGDGVYKSVDGGKTWKNMGLTGTWQIGKIAIHPTDANIVYVGALGRLYGPSEERGLFKTTDGGLTWTKVLYVDDKSGVIDLKMHPTDPETLLVATYERRRDLYDTGDPIQKFGEGSAIHKTTDGGKTFKKLTKGLPTVKLGRIGLDYYRKDPNTVFAVIESEKIGSGPPAKAAKPQPYLGVVGEGPEAVGAKLGQVAPGSPADKAKLKAGDLVKAVGDTPIKDFGEFTTLLATKSVGDKLNLKIERDGQPLEIEVTIEARPSPTPPATAPTTPPPESGEGFAGLRLNPRLPFGAALGGQQENKQDTQGPDGFQTGGVYKSTDGGESWTRINSLNPRPFYFSQIRVDPSDDKYLYILGLALHRSTDGGKSFQPNASRGAHADHHALWIDPKDGRHLILGGDGGFYASYDRASNWDHLNHMAIGQFYHVAIDTKRPYKVYGGLQDNGSWGGPSFSRSGAGPVNEDWFDVGGGDGFHCQVDPGDADQIYSTSQYGAMSRRNLRTGESAAIRAVPERGKVRRWNWNTPFLLSNHNPKIYYAAAEVVFRSLNKGADLRPISPEITRTKQGSATALAESPKNPDVVYVGTDDGALWVTRDGGKQWNDLTKKVGLDRPCFVATIEASRAEEGRAYVAFDGHRSDTDDPLVYVTEDFGETWKSLRANLPRGSSRTLREDLSNPELLYLGTEFGIWASVDRGQSWNKINANLPTVAVHEVAIHPTAGEIVVATHGRSLWALDVSGLRQLTRSVLKEKATLLKPISVIRWQPEPARGGTNRRFIGQNPTRGAQIYIAVTSKVEKASLKILDYDGSTLSDQRVPNDPGLHRLTWNMARGLGGGGPRGGGVGGGGFRRMQMVPPGTYRVVLTVDGKETTQPLKVEADPNYPTAELIAEEMEEEESDEEKAEAEAEGRRVIDID
jgi:photosystem II stability/assembly factor-like uncharacterized protein